MNIITKKTALTTVSLLMMGVMFQSNVLAADGTITFSGKVTAASCSVATESKNLSVFLPSITTEAIGSNVGDMSGQTAFSITLEDCESQTSTAEKVRVAFVGTADSSNVYVLKNAAATNAATGVGLQLLQQDGVTKIDINNGSNKDKEFTIPVKDDGAEAFTLHYNVAYVNTLGSAPTTGDVQAIATYSVEYN